MEMVWEAGEGGEAGEIFTGINYHTYSPPPGLALQQHILLAFLVYFVFDPFLNCLFCNAFFSYMCHSIPFEKEGEGIGEFIN